METKMVINKDIAKIVKNFLENYTAVYRLPSLGRSINRITQLIVFLPVINQYIKIFWLVEKKITN